MSDLALVPEEDEPPFAVQFALRNATKNDTDKELEPHQLVTFHGSGRVIGEAADYDRRVKLWRIEVLECLLDD